MDKCWWKLLREFVALIIRDLDSEQYREDAEEYLESQDFKDIMELAGLDYRQLVEGIKNNDYNIKSVRSGKHEV